MAGKASDRAEALRGARQILKASSTECVRSETELAQDSRKATVLGSGLTGRMAPESARRIVRARAVAEQAAEHRRHRATRFGSLEIRVAGRSAAIERCLVVARHL